MKVYELIERLQSLSENDKQKEIVASDSNFNLYRITDIGIDFARCESKDYHVGVITVVFGEEDLS